LRGERLGKGPAAGLT